MGLAAAVLKVGRAMITQQSRERTKETLHEARLLHNNHLDTKQFPSHIRRRGQVQRGRD